jgi:predicted alpha/beta-hydrolase family hydrolase
VVEPSARYEEVKIPIPDPVHGLEAVSGVIGVPRWWPTGSRVGVVIAHGSTDDMNDPVVEHVHRELTERRYLTLRFNFPFAEAGTRRPDPLPVLRRTMRAAIGALGRDPTAAPAHLFLGGKGLGGQVAADLASSRVRADGLFLMAYPLHPQGKPEKQQPERLFRIVSPVLFVQGDRDRTCDLDVLRGTLTRVGAPTTIHVAAEADRHFKVLKKSQRTDGADRGLGQHGRLDPEGPRRHLLSAESDLYFRQIPVGQMANFAYLVGSKTRREALLVDPAWSVDQLLDQATTCRSWEPSSPTTTRTTWAARSSAWTSRAWPSCWPASPCPST